MVDLKGGRRQRLGRKLGHPSPRQSLPVDAGIGDELAGAVGPGALGTVKLANPSPRTCLDATVTRVGSETSPLRLRLVNNCRVDRGSPLESVR